MYDSEAVLQPQERALVETVGQPGDEDGCERDEDIDEDDSQAIGQGKTPTAEESRQKEYQQRMDNIDAIGYFAHEVTKSVLKVYNGTIKLIHDANQRQQCNCLRSHWGWNETGPGLREEK